MPMDNRILGSVTPMLNSVNNMISMVAAHRAYGSCVLRGLCDLTPRTWMTLWMYRLLVSSGLQIFPQ